MKDHLLEINDLKVSFFTPAGEVKAVNGVTGWVSGNYLVKTSTAVAWVNTRVSNLNVRKGPGTNTAVLGSLPKGTKVTVYSIAGNWAYVTSGKLTGYVSMNYLRF